MKYFPYENITYKTKLDTKEVINRIQKNIELKISFFTTITDSENHKPYEGVVNGMVFKISRIIEHRNSFLPIITGVVKKDVDGAKINVKMELPPIILAFILFWCGSSGSVFMIFLEDSLKTGIFESMILIPFGMFLFVYVMTMGSFKYESIKSKKFLAQLFEAETK